MSDGKAAGEYWGEADFCARMGIKARTAQRWRAEGSGPPYIRAGGRRILYSRQDVEAWAAARTFAHRAAEIAGTPKAGANV